MEHFTDQEFQGPGLPSGGLGKGTYDSCTFRGLDFSEGYLDGRSFIDCAFLDCNLSNANIGGAQFSGVSFRGCKMVGLRLERCGQFLSDLRFERCQLDFASFSGLIMKGAFFEDCSLREADFTGANLSGAVFGRCDLYRALFYNTALEGADFTTALRVSLDPEQNRLRKARFSLEGLPGLLGKYGIEIE